MSGGDLAPEAETEAETGADAETVTNALVAALAGAREHTDPFRHWRVTGLWPDGVADALETLPFAVSPLTYQLGRREENNAARAYFDPARQADHSACRAVAESLQDRRTAEAIERLCGVDLSGSFLRIEYAVDRDGFWLEPHTDIGVKRFTMLVPISTGTDAADWGTDFYADPAGPPLRQPFAANTALIFVPGSDTWHGFSRRPIAGARRSLIVNYVGPEWRARHELCFPDRPVF